MASLAAQMVIANDVLNDWFAQAGGRTIVDDGNAVAEALGMARSQAQAVVRQAAMMRVGLGPQNTAEHWLKKGKEIAFTRNASIRCDGCAAVALYLLKEDSRFTASLHLIEQGVGGMVGHWFVVGGHPGPGIAYPDVFSATCFVVDLWGTVVSNRRAIAAGNAAPYAAPCFHPAACVYNIGVANPLAIRQSWGGEMLALP
jgi:hypothetical protein